MILRASLKNRGCDGTNSASTRACASASKASSVAVFAACDRCHDELRAGSIRESLDVGKRETASRVQHAHLPRLGHRLQQQLQALGIQFRREHRDAGHVAAGARHIGDEAGLEQSAPSPECHDDRDGGGRLPCRENGRRAHRDDDVHVGSDQFRGKRGQPIDIVVGGTRLDDVRLALLMAQRAHGVPERPRMDFEHFRREPSDPRDLRRRLRHRGEGQTSRLPAAAPMNVLRSVITTTSSVQTLKLDSVLRPNVLLIATSAASRPRAMRTRPMRGTLLRGSNVYQWPSMYASNQAAKSIGP